MNGKNVPITIGIEFPYAVVRGAEVNALSARLCGHDLAVALHTYLVKEQHSP